MQHLSQNIFWKENIGELFQELIAINQRRFRQTFKQMQFIYQAEIKELRQKLIKNSFACEQKIIQCEKKFEQERKEIIRKRQIYQKEMLEEKRLIASLRKEIEKQQQINNKYKKKISQLKKQRQQMKISFSKEILQRNKSLPQISLSQISSVWQSKMEISFTQTIRQYEPMILKFMEGLPTELQNQEVDKGDFEFLILSKDNESAMKYTGVNISFVRKQLKQYKNQIKLFLMRSTKHNFNSSSLLQVRHRVQDD